jgi:hypothetical protein
MDRRNYLRTVIEIYLDQPDTPTTASPSDWAVAATFFQQRLPLQTVTHAIRLPTLRRHLRDSTTPLEPVHSIAYYRHVLATLKPLKSDDLDPAYIADVARRAHRLDPRHSSKSAV